MTGTTAWTTRAGEALAGKVIVEAGDGRPVILRSRRAGAVDALLREAENSGFAAQLLEPTGDPLACLAGLLSAGASAATHSRLVEIIAADGLSDALVIVSVPPGSEADWLTFAGTFATARATFSGAAASLVLLLAENHGCPAGCIALDDNNIVDPIDAHYFARTRGNWPQDLLGETATAAVIEVCRGEFELIESLLDLDPKQAFNPVAALAERLPDHGARLQFWRGRDEACPGWLLRTNSRFLQRRVWRGHLHALFPWLEEVRVDLIEAAAGTLPARWTDERTGEQIAREDFEFLHLALTLGKTGRHGRQAQCAHDLRVTRNELAHCRPLEYEQFVSAVRAARELKAAFEAR